jgi:hypothetical protein
MPGKKNRLLAREFAGGVAYFIAKKTECNFGVLIKI